MNAHEVADYLQRHPEFFEQYAELFASVTIPHPHGGRAISLTERQMMTLRDRHKALELRLAELIRFGQENDALAEKLARWTRLLLLENTPANLPDTLTAALAETFGVPHVALRLWESAAPYAELDCSQPVPLGLVNYTNQMPAPYCGKPLEANSGAAALIDATVGSMAIVALRRPGATDAFGMLVLASPDAKRFHDQMATDFLACIGDTASAALLRLLA